MILVRYLLRGHVAPFITAFLVITFLFAINYILDVLDQVLSKGLPINVLLEVLVLSLAWMLALSVPMGILVAVLMNFGRMSGDNEIVALKAAGVNPLSLLRPVLLMGVLMALLLYVFNDKVLPEANHRAGSLLSSIARKRPQAFIEEKKMVTNFPGIAIWVDKIDPQTGGLKAVRLIEFEHRKPIRLTRADSAWIEKVDDGQVLLFHLYNGSTHSYDNVNEQRYTQFSFSRQSLTIGNVNSGFERKERSYRGDREMDVDSLWVEVGKARKRKEKQLSSIKNKDFAQKWDVLLKVENRPHSNRGDEEISNSRVKRVFEKPKIFSFTKKKIPGKSDFKVKSKLELEIESPKAKVRKTTREPTPPKKWRVNTRDIAKVLSAEKVRASKLKRLENRWIQAEKDESKYLVEIHKKASIPFACVVFILVGMPLGVMARKGGVGTGVVYSLVFFVIFWVGLMAGENLADKLYLPAWFAMWSPNIIVGGIGSILVYKMWRDKYTGHKLIPWGRVMKGLKSLFRFGGSK
jgi:lipopolysaccharide export system permease protein